MSKSKISKKEEDPFVPEIISANPGFGFHSLNSDGQFMQISQTELDWLGYAREEVIGKLRFQDLLAAGDKKRFEKRFPVFQKTGIARDVEYQWVSKDGSLVPISISGTAIRKASGEFRTVAVVVNLSQRKQTEATARHLALRQQREDLVSLIVNDIKEPLLGAAALLDKLWNGKFETSLEQKATIKELQSTNRQILQRIEIMLDINYYEEKSGLVESVSKSDPETMHQMPLWKVIEDCVLAVSKTENFIDKRLSFDLDLNSSSILVDNDAFETLINHLLENAAQYSPKGGRIGISCQRSPYFFELSISDEGTGVPEESIDILFTRFSKRNRKAFPVIGMGLFLCARIAEVYGGNITCVNQPGSGAKISVKIPMRTDRDCQKSECQTILTVEKFQQF